MVRIAGSTGLVTPMHSVGITHYCFAAAAVVTFLALVVRSVVKREHAFWQRQLPIVLTVDGAGSTATRQWWLMAFAVKTPDGWRRIERALGRIAAFAAMVAVASLLAGAS